MGWDEVIGERVRAITWNALPASVAERAVVICLHDLAMGYRGALQSWAASVIGDTASAPGYWREGLPSHPARPEAVAESHAVAMASTVCEDFYGAVHLGPVILSSVLAVCEAEHVGPDGVLEAVIAGFEAGITIQDLVGAEVAQRGIRTTPFVGALASAYALSKLAGWSCTQTASMVTRLASGAWFGSYPLANGTDEWIYQSGAAARAVVDAFRRNLYFIAPNNAPLQSFIEWINPRAAEQPGGSKDGMTRPAYRIAEVGVKRYPTNVYVQPAVDAAAQLAGRVGDIADIQSITVRVTPSVAAGKSHVHPGPFRRPLQGVLSIPVGVAMALVYPGFTFADFTRSNDESVQALARRVKVVADASCQLFGCSVEIRTSEGCAQESIHPGRYFPSVQEELEFLRQQRLLDGVFGTPWGARLKRYCEG